MKRKILLLGAVLTLTFGLSMNAYAADETVTFTDSKALTYGNGGSLGAAFEGMAPGQSKEVTIDVVNDNAITADFYVNTADIKALEEIGKKTGGAYDIKLSVDNGTSTPTVLYDSTLGGASGSQDGTVIQSAEGIKGMKNLADSTFLATLKNGEKVQLILDFTMDGESITNKTSNDYSNAVGQIGFQFLVAYDTEGNRVIVNREDIVEYQTGQRKQSFVTTVKNVVVAVKTGDDTAIIPIIAILAAGLLLLAVTGKKKKRNGEAS